jgi:hypothetical protein
MVGREGSGKSMTTASVLEAVDPSFDESRVFFDPADLMGFITELSSSEREGKAVMLDEAGVGMGVRSWYDKDQIKINKAAQTMRDDNMILATTLPSFSLMDSQLRTRHHGFCEMRDVQHGDYAVFSWKDIIVNREENGNTIKRKQFPRYESGGRRQRISRLKISPPSDSFIDAYEDKKQEFKQALYEEVVDDATEDDDRGPKDVADEVIDNEKFEAFVSVNSATGNEYIDKDKLYMEYPDLTHRGARAAKKLVEEAYNEEKQ